MSAEGRKKGAPALALLAAVLVLMPTGIPAQSIYIWTDEAGITHFTDRKPDTDREVTVQRAIAEPERMLDMVLTGPADDPQWIFRNRIHGPLAVRVRLADADNVVSNPQLPHVFVLPSLAERELVTIGALDPTRSWRYQLTTETMPGDPAASHQPDQAYRPPFASNESYTIGQAFGGEHSHTDPASYYAVDFNMPIGTPIHTARGGMVMDLARWFHGAGQNLERHGPRANFVRILHDDGSMAVYAHLDYEGVRVRAGQRIQRGQLIGKSGNTGFTTGPHLHFVIQVNRDMSLVSVPFEFEDADGQAITPSRGLRIEAP